MYSFGSVVVVWIVLTFLNGYKHVLGSTQKMETLEKAFWLIATASALLYMGDYAATHLSFIHIPEVNATDSSRYIWVPIPRVFPPFPSTLSMFLLGVILVSAVTAISLEILDRRRSLEERITVEPGTETKPSRIEIGGKHFDSHLYLTGELGSLDYLVTIPKERLWVMGISLSEFSIKYRYEIPRLLEKGVAIRFLLLNPQELDSKEPDLVERFVDATGAPDTSTRITTSLGVLATLRTQYPTKLEVKQYDLLPFHSMIVLDDSFIQVGFYLYKAGPPNRPQAIVSRSLHSDIFEKLIGSYEAAWRMARPV